MRPINLLPPDERGRPAERLAGGVLGILLIIGALAVVAMVGIYLLMFLRLQDIEDQVAELDDQIAQENARLAELSPYRDLEARLQAKKPIADGIFSTRLAWDQFLQGLAFVIPETTALDAMAAEASPVSIDAPAEEPLQPAGTVTFNGVALPRFENVADFVVRMDNLQYLANAEIDVAARQGSSQNSPVSFSVASELVTIAGENGTEVRLEGGSQDEIARSPRRSPGTREVANVGATYGASAARDHHAGRGGGRR